MLFRYPNVDTDVLLPLEQEWCAKDRRQFQLDHAVALDKAHGKPQNQWIVVAHRLSVKYLCPERRAELLAVDPAAG